MTFRDVDLDTWYTDAIIWGNHAKTVVVKGYSAEAFGPEDPITRENNRVDPLANATRAEVATVLARFVRFCEK